MPIPEKQQLNNRKIRCLFCDNVLGIGKFVGKIQMYCLNKNNTSCGRKLEITATETSIKIEEVKEMARDSPTL